jgi:amidohydrolase
VGRYAGYAGCILGLLFCVGRTQPGHAATFDSEVANSLPVVQRAYEFLHTNPELGKKEFKAHDFLLGQLRALGFSHFEESKLAPTAVIAVLSTGRPGPTIALRAEMDARPLEYNVDEPLDHNPRSTIAHVMHNCGHDAHAAILLGTAATLIRNPTKFAGTIVFVFQPAEETKGGADDLVNEGILARLGIRRMIAEHSAPGLPVGTVAMAPGATLAGSSYFRLDLKGRGSHAAAPYEGDDVLLAGTRIAEAMSYWPARRIDIANRPAVISITRFVADSNATNALPTEVEIKGTLRTFEDPKQPSEGGTSLESALVATIAGLAKADGLTFQWDLRAGSPPTINSPAVFSEVSGPLARVFPGTVDTKPTRGMFSEDFAYYTPSIPSLYISLGIAKGPLGHASVHTPEFTIHPDAFRYGLILMTRVAEIETTRRSEWQ